MSGNRNIEFALREFQEQMKDATSPPKYAGQNQGFFSDNINPIGVQEYKRILQEHTIQREMNRNRAEFEQSLRPPSFLEKG